MILRMSKPDVREKNSSIEQATQELLINSLVSELRTKLDDFDSKIRKECVDRFTKLELSGSYITAVKIISSIKEVLSFRRSKKKKKKALAVL